MNIFISMIFATLDHLADVSLRSTSLEPDLVFVDFFLISSTFGFLVDVVDSYAEGTYFVGL